MWVFAQDVNGGGAQGEGEEAGEEEDVDEFAVLRVPPLSDPVVGHLVVRK